MDHSRVPLCTALPEPSEITEEDDSFLDPVDHFRIPLSSASPDDYEIIEKNDDVFFSSLDKLCSSDTQEVAWWIGSPPASQKKEGVRTDQRTCSIKNLDNGQKYVVHELGEDGEFKLLKETESNRLIRMEDFEESLGLSSIVQRLMSRKFYVNRSLMVRRVEVQCRRKSCRELSALYMGQEIQAHKGFIWAMKFSPDGRYLASGGADGRVLVWQVTQSLREELSGIPDTKAFCNYLNLESTSEPISSCNGKLDINFMRGQKALNSNHIVVPEMIFKISEKTLYEFYGHTNDVLDLSWSSKSKYLLSSSKDKTVRLWELGCNEYLETFHHYDYVTCVQFNPINDGYFISGSIDSKVRIWRISKRQVVDWIDAHEIITAVCYQPDGQGCVVGSVTGNCRSYVLSDNGLQLGTQELPWFQKKSISKLVGCRQSRLGRKKSSGKRIISLQFCPENPQRIFVTSADSKVRVFDGADIFCKNRGPQRSESQISASFTSNGRYIVSASEDSSVFVWNCNGYEQVNTLRSCEHFFSNGVSVAIPWPGINPKWTVSRYRTQYRSFHMPEQLHASSWCRDLDRFSVGGVFFEDCPLKRLATWPLEKLPPSSQAVAEGHHHHHHPNLSATWGLVIVTASCDGVIRTFHNFGFPIRA